MREKESWSGMKGESRDREIYIYNHPLSLSCLSSSSSYLSLTPSHCPRESICYCFCVCGRRGERSERGCISVGGKPGDQHEVGGGEYGCQSRSRCFKATLFGPTKRRPGRANCAGVVSYHQIGQEERESRGKRALSKLERDGQIDTCS